MKENTMIHLSGKIESVVCDKGTYVVYLVEHNARCILDEAKANDQIVSTLRRAFHHELKVDLLMDGNNIIDVKEAV